MLFAPPRGALNLDEASRGASVAFARQRANPDTMAEELLQGAVSLAASVAVLSGWQDGFRNREDYVLHLVWSLGVWQVLVGLEGVKYMGRIT